MKWWAYKYLIFLFVFSLLIQTSYGTENVTSQICAIELKDTNNQPVKEATIEVFSINGSFLYSLYTNENGTASFPGEQNATYNFIIKAENYEIASKNVTILPTIPDNKIKFTLKPSKNPKDSNFLLIFIPSIIGLLVFVYWFIRFYHGRFFSIPLMETIGFNLLCVILILSWPAVILYLLYKGEEYILLSELRFSVYIPVEAIIGVVAYLLLSVQETFSQSIPKYKKKSIEFGYLRRITIAPYIAILGVYILLDAARIQNFWFILLFSFFSGMFTKTIEEWLYKAVKGLLPQELREEIKERVEYNVENSDLVVKIKVDEDAAYRLYHNGIRNVEQLALLDGKNDEIEKLISKEVKKEYLTKIIDDAVKHLKMINELKKRLNFTASELDLLFKKAKVYSIIDFAYLDIESIDWGGKVPAENKKISDLFIQKQSKAKEIAKTEVELKFLSLRDLQELYKNFNDKTPEEYIEIINLHTDVIEKGIYNWTAKDTKKLLEHGIKTLSELKQKCESEQGKKYLEKIKEDIPGISELIEKIV